MEASVKLKSDKPLISITLPISSSESPNLVSTCLNSLSNQTYNNFEVIVVTPPNTNKKISLLLKLYPFTKIYFEDLNKTAARNFAVKRSKGKYIFYIDADYELTPDVVSECIEKTIKERSLAVITPKAEAPRSNFWSKCRSLERELFWGHPYAESPDFIEKSTFDSVGGFDENLDPLDDWYLQLSLKRRGVTFSRIDSLIYVRESLNFKELIARKYQRGRLIPSFLDRFPNTQQTKLSAKLRLLWSGRKKILSQPHLALGLTVLKLPETLALWWGMLQPLRRQKTSTKNVYSLPEIAASYDEHRLNTNYKRYKHFAEVKSLLDLLAKKKKHKILEVGCGTGRITQELVKKGYTVKPTDVSPAMISEYLKKKTLPKPVLTKDSLLPFPNNSYQTAVSIRVVWHILKKEERERFIFELIRVASEGIVADFTNRKRIENRLIRMLTTLFTIIYPQGYKVHGETHFFDLKKLKRHFTSKGVIIQDSTPLDTIIPIWLNILPEKVANRLFPLVLGLDRLSAKVIPPTRYLLRISKN